MRNYWTKVIKNNINNKKITVYSAEDVKHQSKNKKWYDYVEENEWSVVSFEHDSFFLNNSKLWEKNHAYDKDIDKKASSKPQSMMKPTYTSSSSQSSTDSSGIDEQEMEEEQDEEEEDHINPHSQTDEIYKLIKEKDWKYPPKSEVKQVKEFIDGMTEPMYNLLWDEMFNYMDRKARTKIQKLAFQTQLQFGKQRSRDKSFVTYLNFINMICVIYLQFYQYDFCNIFKFY